MARRSRASASLRFRLARLLLRSILGSLFDVRVEGLGLLPTGPYILACNHLNWVDPFLLLAYLPASPRVNVLGRRSAIYNRRWKRRVLLYFGGVIPVEPGQGLNEMIAEVNTALERGDSLALFPEGGVGSVEGDVRPLRHGVAHFARHSGLPVTPAGLSGTHELWLRKRITLRIGEPLRVDSDDLLFELERIAAAMRAALPSYVEAAGPRHWRWLTRLLR